MRASFPKRMVQRGPKVPSVAAFVSASGLSLAGSLAGVGIGGSAPVWASTPSVSVQATVAGGPVAFSFTGGTPTSVTVEPGDTLPSYFTLSLAGISWNATATAGATYSFRLRATNASGFSTSNVISGTVAAAPVVTTGLWATPINYGTPATWGQYARDNTTRLGNPAHTIGYNNTGYVGSKDTLGVYVPSRNRV